jgi:hypothetical protein
MRISFIVADRTVTRMEIEFKDQPDCTILVSTQQPINQNSLIVRQRDARLSMEIGATFTSDTAISGKLSVDSFTNACVEIETSYSEWSASKQE